MQGPRTTEQGPETGRGSVFHRLRARRLVTGWVLLVLLWLAFSAKFDLFHIGTGVIAVTLIMWQHSALPQLGKREAPPLRPLRVLLYIPWLLWQMLRSAVYVAVIILHHPRKIEPRVLSFRCNQPSDLQHVLFANSITLTPGTLTLDLKDGHYLVHSLTKATGEDLMEGDMARRVARLSGNKGGISLIPEEGGRPEEG
ncbi:MAG: cation transporter [Verrucomicrobia bacterium]|jgi:multicomponent Na+:H+ antiporter subunit E|nr:cation transporter [Verrucomicrobiota bacterium]